jgi:hypothetical protein
VVKLTSQQGSVLARLWRKKLKASGFVDAERPDGQLQGPPLTRGDRRRSWSLASPVERAAIRGYFEAAEKFKSRKAYYLMEPRDRLVWRLHAGGMSNVEVARCAEVTIRRVKTVIGNCRKAAGLPESTMTIGRPARPDPEKA